MSHPAAPQPAERRHDRTGETQTPIAAVSKAIDQLRYGVIQLTVHDGRVVQLDVTERQRFS